LTKLPYGKPEVDEFHEEHLKNMEGLMDFVRGKYASDPNHLEDWNTWYLF
jgi:hypothetical protein